MIRALAAAFLTATLAALATDAALQLALDAVRVSAYGGGAPWWVTAHVIERGRWVVFALLLWGAARTLPLAERGLDAAAPDRAEAWRLVAVAIVAVPLLWIVATWAASAVRFTLLDSWAFDGQAFVSPDYYRGLLLDLAPWIMAAAALLAIRKHL